MASGLYNTPLLAINSQIYKIKEEIKKVKREFDYIYKSRKLDNQPEGLDRLSLLEL
jgi:hypothetical protein